MLLSDPLPEGAGVAEVGVEAPLDGGRAGVTLGNVIGGGGRKSCFDLGAGLTVGGGRLGVGCGGGAVAVAGAGARSTYVIGTMPLAPLGFSACNHPLSSLLSTTSTSSLRRASSFAAAGM